MNDGTFIPTRKCGGVVQPTVAGGEGMKEECHHELLMSMIEIKKNSRQKRERVRTVKQVST